MTKKLRIGRVDSIKEKTRKFIHNAKLVHNNKFSYEKSKYIAASRKIEIICPVHGSFWQSPTNHINGGYGCALCSNRKKLTQEDFIMRSSDIHKNKYDYSESVYLNGKSMVDIICPIHSTFSQRAEDHLAGHGCLKCGGNKKLDTKQFIEESTIIHNNKYNYSEVEYVDSHTKVKILCKQHGSFFKVPYVHKQGQGCPECIRDIPEYSNIYIMEFREKLTQKKYLKVGLTIRQDPIQRINKNTKDIFDIKLINFFQVSSKFRYVVEADILSQIKNVYNQSEPTDLPNFDGITETFVFSEAILNIFEQAKISFNE